VVLLAHGAAQEPSDVTYGQIISSRGRIPEGLRLERLIALYLKNRQGVPKVSVVDGEKVRWISRNASDIAAKRRQTSIALDAARSINEARLSSQEKVDWRLLLHVTKAEANLARFPTEYLDTWPELNLDDIDRLARESSPDYEEILAWLRGVPLTVRESLDTLRQGLAHGITLPRGNAQRILNFGRRMTPADPMASRYLYPFKQFPPSVFLEQQKVLAEKAVTVYRSRILPAYDELAGFLENTYIPATRPFQSMIDLPHGAAWYAARLWERTGLDSSPEEIHRAGLTELRRAQQEIEAIARSTGFTGNYNEFVVASRNDPRCAPMDETAIRTQFQTLMHQVEGLLPKLFGTIPKTPYEVVPIASAAGNPGSAFGGSSKEGRPGQVRVQSPFLNGACDFPAVILHEALPGHLLQMHVASESDTISALRESFSWWPVFGEGWAHYATGLAAELGLKLNAYERAAVVSGEVFFATRTVVETGIHLKGWSRDQAMEYYRTNLGWAPPESIGGVVDTAVNELSFFPSYVVGYQKIVALRAEAERELGPRFDIRMFHDELLRYGPLPLDVLDAQIRDWIAAQKRAPARP